MKLINCEHAMQLWNFNRNSVDVNDILFKSNKIMWWKCPNGDDHEWQAPVSRITSGSNCPFCSGRKVCNSNCLSNTNPDIAKEWHPDKNGDITPNDVTRGCGKCFWWLCYKNPLHEWKTSVNNRTNIAAGKGGCPFCANQKVSNDNCLANVNPKLAKQWHSKNTVSANEVILGSNKLFWWKCDVSDDHEWVASINNRNQGRGCPYCCGKKATKSNCLISTHPELICEWDDSNKVSPYNVTHGSSMIVSWVCIKNKKHKWKAAICYRTGKRKTGCPFCNESKGEKLVASILTNMGVNFKRQYKFADCVNKSKLRFDFAILDNKQKVVALIEYNGRQHYFKNSFFNGFECTIENDKIKTQYCARYNIPFLVIRYSIVNVRNCIEKFMKGIVDD